MEVSRVLQRMVHSFTQFYLFVCLFALLHNEKKLLLLLKCLLLWWADLECAI